MDPMQMPLPPDHRLPQPMPDAPIWGGPLGLPPTWTQVPGVYGPSVSSPTTRAGERIGDAERTRTCDELAAHYAAGRLSPVDLDTRLAAAVEAVTMRDLHVLNRDLPRLGAPVPPGPAPVPLRRGPWTATDVLVLMVLLGSMLLAGVMLLGLGAYDFALFLAACVGGTAAFTSGAALVHLTRGRSASASAHRLT